MLRDECHLSAVSSRLRWLHHPVVWVVILLIVSYVATEVTFIPISRQFVAADDYAIYTYFAEAASRGFNPYSVPATFRSVAVPTFFKTGWTQPTSGVVRQQYADYPPGLMLLYTLLFSSWGIKGLYWFLLASYFVSCYMFMWSAASRPEQKWELSGFPVAFFVFMSLNSLIVNRWFVPISDKAFFAALISLMLVCRHWTPALLFALSLLASFKGVGVIVLLYYMVYMVRQTGARALWKYRWSLVLFCVIVVLSHIPWFPAWLHGYRWRLARQSCVCHESLFVILQQAGLYTKALPKTCTVITLMTLLLLILTKRLSLEESLVLPVCASIVFNPDMGADRVLLVTVMLTYVTRSSLVAICGLVLGWYISSLPVTSSIKLLWLWIAGLVAYVSVMIIRRVFGRVFLQTNNVQSYEPQGTIETKARCVPLALLAQRREMHYATGAMITLCIAAGAAAYWFMSNVSRPSTNAMTKGNSGEIMGAVSLLINGEFDRGLEGWELWRVDDSYSNHIYVISCDNERHAVRIENPYGQLIGIKQFVNLRQGEVYRLSGTVRSVATNESSILFGGRVAVFLPPQPEQQLIWMSEYNRWWEKELVFTNQVTGTAVVYVHLGYGNVATTGEFTGIRLERVGQRVVE